jgi:6,7-dimethyl-8-ribityllumazine synthase
MSSVHQNLSEIKNLPDSAGKKIAIIVSKWNDSITNALLDGAVKTLLSANVKQVDIVIKEVPGTFELPFGAQQMIRSIKPDAVICLGCVIQGETRHFDFICDATANGIMRVSLDNELPVIFGVLTTDTMQQAVDRSGGLHGNKGIEAAATALQLL